MKIVRTRHLEVETLQSGPKEGPPVFLLHGRPDNAHTWDEVAPYLNKAGFRTIAPMLRGFDRSRFLSTRTARTGNVGVLAIDALELAEFQGPFRRITLEGVGHFPTREAPEIIGPNLVEHFSGRELANNP